MIFEPQSKILTKGSLYLSGNLIASAHPCLCKDIFGEFWHNFSFGCSNLQTKECKELVFSVGNGESLPLDGYSYVINVTEKGIFLTAGTETELIHGFMTLLDLFKATDVENGNAIELECCQIKDSAEIKTRMVHFCIFPETELWELRRFVRFCGALKYTHVVLEFWGMLRYDCLRELSWSHAFSKDEIRPIIDEAKNLGLEIIPMFNHWGHASAGRVMHGKHVVLDQNPSLQTYFSEDGWCWDIRKSKVKSLLRQIREELIDLCGDGKYFHIGCDEAYNFVFSTENMNFICDFINEIAEEMDAAGRRVIAWGDMFLFKHPDYNKNNDYCCKAPSPEAEQYLLNRLSRKVIVADWQYDSVQPPIETSAVFTKAGFDCLLCPWEKGEAHAEATARSVLQSGLFGFLQTTWHTLSRRMPILTMMAKGAYEPIGTEENSAFTSYNTVTSALLRKVMPSHGEYRNCGWSPSEVSFLW